MAKVVSNRARSSAFFTLEMNSLVICKIINNWISPSSYYFILND